MFFILTGIPYADILCVKSGGGGGCYSSIQDAIDAATDDDTIRVAEGYYTETIEIDKSLVLEGGWNAEFTERDYETHITTIDACGVSCAVHIIGAFNITVDGFIIKGGNSTTPLGWGGGIWVDGSVHTEGHAIIRNNVITENIASNAPSGQGYGGGIQVYNASAHIENNKIHYNIAQNAAGKGGSGGGVQIYGWQSVAVITGNEITSNTAAISSADGWQGKGGGFNADSVFDVTFQNNVVYGNVAAVDGPGQGGGVFAYGKFYGNRISRNTASVNEAGEGGGVYASYAPYFEDNIIEYNVASENGDGTGGGICSLQMQRCRRNHIIGNSATRGGGVYLKSYSHTDFTGNTVAYNQATGNSDATLDGGGGISTEDASCYIFNNDIYDNTTAYYGGGIQITGGSAFLIKGNRIKGNSAGAGGGISMRGGTGIIIDNTLENNHAAAFGGGMHVIKTAAPTLDRNIIMNNVASGFFVAGGAMAIGLDPPANITIRNHIIAKNEAGAGGIGAGIIFATGILNLENCAFADNDAGTYKQGLYLYSKDGVHNITNCIFKGHSTGIQLGTDVNCNIDYCAFFSNDEDYNAGTIGANNLYVDPKFQNPAVGNYRLQSDSQLINAGNTITGLYHDFEGDPRPHGAGYDIGADEFYHSVVYVSAFSGNNETGDGSSEKPYASIGKALNEVQTAGTILVARGPYFGCYNINRSVNLAGGYTEIDWSRNINLYVTALDGYAMGNVIEISGMGVRALVEGFSIHGGRAYGLDNGSGIIIHSGASGVIRFNRIWDNIAKDSGGGIAIYNESGKECVIDSNHIYDNRALGIWEPIAPPPSSHISMVAIGTGGGIMLVNAPAVITNNFIHHNIAAQGGDGVALVNHEKSMTFVNNSVSDNGSSFGQGLRLLSSTRSRVNLYNNLFVGHYKGVYLIYSTGLEHDYNGYFNNFIHLEGMPHGANDVFGDPLFCSRSSGDLHIRQGSSALNQGLNDPAITPEHDIDGDARPYGAQVDIGADEMLGNSPPMFEFIHPSADKRIAKSSFPITWIVEDVDNNASINLYYKKNKSEYIGGMFHIGNAMENDPNHFWNWDVSEVPEEIYWIRAHVSDGVNPTMKLYSPYPVKVTKVTPEMICDHILGRGAIPMGRIPYANLNEDCAIDVADLVMLQSLP